MSESNSNSNFIEHAKDWMNANPSKALGVFIGLVIGILLITMGIGKTILVVIFMGVGYLLGRSRDENISVMDQINKFLKKDQTKQ